MTFRAAICRGRRASDDEDDGERPGREAAWTEKAAHFPREAASPSVTDYPAVQETAVASPPSCDVMKMVNEALDPDHVPISWPDDVTVPSGAKTTIPPLPAWVTVRVQTP